MKSVQAQVVGAIKRQAELKFKKGGKSACGVAYTSGPLALSPALRPILPGGNATTCWPASGEDMRMNLSSGLMGTRPKEITHRPLREPR
jgi:hypothetical protein